MKQPAPYNVITYSPGIKLSMHSSQIDRGDIINIYSLCMIGVWTIKYA